MTKKELQILVDSIKLAMTNSLRHGGASSDRGLGMRYASYDVANEIWYNIVSVSEKHLKQYPSRKHWLQACGFEQ